MKQHLIDWAEQVSDLKTPAFIVDEQQLRADAETARSAIKSRNTKLLFAMKSFSIEPALQSLSSIVDGFHASSLFEAKLARQILGGKGIIHLTTPGLRADEYEELNHLCDYISFNSLTQWQTFQCHKATTTKCGLRINPQLSLIEDERYDPCRVSSKLGVSLQQLQSVFNDDPQLLENISGLLIHSNCDATDFSGLIKTFKRLDQHHSKLLEKLEWLNLGGGYLFNEIENTRAFHELIENIEHRYQLQILFEPGAGISRKAGYLVSTVLDIFESDGRQVVVLDTSVNHMPEVFEYQFTPDVISDSENAKFTYRLTGSTCLAGDIFGDYAFESKLHIGSRIIFYNAGAYTMVKAHFFNGLNLPSIYMFREDGNASLIKQFNFNDYLTHCGAG